MNWRDIPTLGKGQLIPMTPEYFYKICGMRDELIFEQEKEISRLKQKVNKLNQKIERLTKTKRG